MPPSGFHAHPWLQLEQREGEPAAYASVEEAGASAPAPYPRHDYTQGQEGEFPWGNRGAVRRQAGCCIAPNPQMLAADVTIYKSKREGRVFSTRPGRKLHGMEKKGWVWVSRKLHLQGLQ